MPTSPTPPEYHPVNKNNNNNNKPAPANLGIESNAARNEMKYEMQDGRYNMIGPAVSVVMPLARSLGVVGDDCSVYPYL